MDGVLAELPPWARSLLESERVGRLGLLDDSGAPRVLPIAFALHGGRVWSAIDRKRKRPGREPARLRYLRSRPQVAFTVDRYRDDWAELAWVQLLGSAAVVASAEHPEAAAALRSRYPAYRDEPPPGPLIRIRPERALHWRA